MNSFRPRVKYVFFAAKGRRRGIPRSASCSGLDSTHLFFLLPLIPLMSPCLLVQYRGSFLANTLQLVFFEVSSAAG